MNLAKFALGVALVALVVGAGGYFYPVAKQAFGEIGTRFPNGIYVGPISAGVSKVSGIAFGTCALIAPSYTVTASTTAAFDCAAAAVLPTDLFISSELATSTAAGTGWQLVGVSASSTAGFITYRIANNTGTTAVIPASLASSTAWSLIR